MNSKSVSLHLVKRLSRETFRLGIAYIHEINPDIQLTDDGYERWFEALEAFPDDVFMRAIADILETSTHFPRLSEISGLCFRYFPQRELEINAAETLTKREKLNKVLSRWKDEGIL